MVFGSLSVIGVGYSIEYDQFIYHRSRSQGDRFIILFSTVVYCFLGSTKTVCSNIASVVVPDIDVKVYVMQFKDQNILISSLVHGSSVQPPPYSTTTRNMTQKSKRYKRDHF